MTQLQIIQHNNQRVLTTAQLAESFGSETQILVNNFNRNKERYTEGKHFILLQGSDLREFRAKNQIDFPPNTNRIYLWTEKGAWMHAKSLNTDKAWDAYEMLVDDYYSVLEQAKKPMSQLELVAFLANQAVLKEQEDARRDQEIKAIKSGMETLTENLMAVPDAYKVADLVNEYCRWTRLGHNEAYNRIYDIMKDRHGIDVPTRVQNARDELNRFRLSEGKKVYAESTLKGKINGIDIMVRIGALDKFHSILVGLLAKEKGRAGTFSSEQAHYQH